MPGFQRTAGWCEAVTQHSQLASESSAGSVENQRGCRKYFGRKAWVVQSGRSRYRL